ncbi:Transposon Tn7 transposition protein TnsA [Halomonadaceae bacterium LMG 33818]|uniref:TnsA endonuclease C-terminal domain-containing protein n=1 Tax=Cernens ardua TaxID=3402176 RepID=UPI003EDBAD7D
MSKTFKGLTQKQIDQRIADGRGEGHGQEYKPFIYTRDVSSFGRSHRLPGLKTNRLHHLLSDLELAVFFILDWSLPVVDIREQFPMRVEDTTRICDEYGLPQARFKGTAQVLSTDFLVDLEEGITPSQVAIQAKYSADLEKSSVIERLEIERRYWESKGILWKLVTEREFSKTVFSNIQWLYPGQVDSGISNEELTHYEALFLHELERSADKPLRAIAQKLDVAYRLDTGVALYWLRRLLANRRFSFDIRIPVEELTAQDLAHQGTQFEEVLHASS